MLTVQSPSAGVDDKLLEHEDAAHEKRNWVRLTFDCNNHCVFCLDTLTHDGQMRDANEVKQQIIDGARKGAQRLILSGGEPTMHPRYVDFIRLGKAAKYRKIQTVTNGRAFAYKDFLKRCLDAGLDEITFSIHGPNARIHDALVGAKGAFEQEVQGLQYALEDGRPIVNIDVVINRGNVKHLKAILEKFIAMGVREYDLLHVIPFGNAYKEGRDILFYDLEEMRPHLLEAFAFSKRPDVHIWLNRFPVQHLEGYESLIQDPYKLNDEAKGRKEEFHRLLTEGVDLDCREPARCKLCYLQNVCDTLYGVRDQVIARDFTRLRVDATWEQKQGPIWGGDPASSKRARAIEAQLAEGGLTVLAPAEDVDVDAPRAKLRLPVVGQVAQETPLSAVPPAALAVEAGVNTLWVVAPDVASALAEIARHPGITAVELELADFSGLDVWTSERSDVSWRVTRAIAWTSAQAEALLSMPGDFEVTVALTQANEPWLLARGEVARLGLFQPNYERMSEAKAQDVDLRAFFGRFAAEVPVEGVPACVTGRAPRQPPRTLDTAMMRPDGQLEIFRYIQRYIQEHYKARSLRCKPCVHASRCDGMHINYIRAHGYELMQPVLADAE
ncbi:MAG: radical SAM protein [Deltaproteobacteria bacterium]|nr:radical SAM protein [Deltaproteobacteria bacterium]